MISLASMNRFVFALLLATLPIASYSQTFETLLTFDGPNGANPVDTPLVQGRNGELYGTTLGGGVYGSGTVFKIALSGKLTVLHSFCAQANCSDGALPYGGLVLGTDGDFYGTTFQGGSDGVNGTIFKITPNGTYTVLHNFSGPDGSGPGAPLIQGTDGDFYGITQSGGYPLNAGTMFKISPAGTFTSLYAVQSGDGSDFNGPLAEASDGNFYGTAELGGASGDGIIFKLTPGGTFSTIHSFDYTDGSAPACGLVQAADGNLYGTTYGGGSSSDCPNGCGTFFQLTLQGALTTLHNFDSSDGANPIAALAQATDGNFYGTSYAGGTKDWGTVFEITPNGTVTTLHNFLGTDGGQPYGPVSQNTNGNIYGTSTNGSVSGLYGTLFVITTDLNSFISLVQETGRTGQTIGILGQGLQGATGVSFNGMPADFSVVSATYIAATIPSGASSGFVEVTTSGGTLRSNVRFRIVP